MGFLDSMLGELVRRETGFNATRLIRKVGTKRLLMMGGAALAGGVLAQKAGRSNLGGSGADGFGSAMFGAGGSSTMSGSGVRREANLPPLPGTSSSAGVPPVPTGSEEKSVVPDLPNLASADGANAVIDSGDSNPELLYAIIRTMVSAALSDGELASQEKSAIERHLGESGLNDRQQAQVRRDLVVPAAPAELAGMLPEGEDPEILLEFAVLVLRADGELADTEVRWLESLAGLLDVDVDVDEDGRTVVSELVRDLFPPAE